MGGCSSAKEVQGVGIFPIYKVALLKKTVRLDRSTYHTTWNFPMNPNFSQISHISCLFVYDTFILDRPVIRSACHDNPGSVELNTSFQDCVATLCNTADV